MGWTITHKDLQESAADFLKRKCLTWSVPPEAHPTVIATAAGSNCIAFAVRFPAAFWERRSRPQQTFVPEKDRSITTALVFLMSGGERGSRAYNFGYKDMDESCGPYAPVSASILRHLSPIDLENGGDPARWAEAWRDRCKAYSAARSRRRLVRPASLTHGDSCTRRSSVSTTNPPAGVLAASDPERKTCTVEVTWSVPEYRAGPACLDSAPRNLSGFLPGYAERGALRFCGGGGRA